ncbi:MAG: PH domain-containing protein [Elusimicrobiota bacterium]
MWNWWASLLTADLLIILAAALWWTRRDDYAAYSLAGAVFLYSGVAILRLGSSYLLTNHRAITRRGLLARRLDEVEICDIRNITLEQTFFQRLIGIGDVGLSSAGGDGIEVCFDGVGNPDLVKEHVRGARRTPAGAPRDLR